MRKQRKWHPIYSLLWYMIVIACTFSTHSSQHAMIMAFFWKELKMSGNDKIKPKKSIYLYLNKQTIPCFQKLKKKEKQTNHFLSSSTTRTEIEEDDDTTLSVNDHRSERGTTESCPWGSCLALVRMRWTLEPRKGHFGLGAQPWRPQSPHRTCTRNAWQFPHWRRPRSGSGDSDGAGSRSSSSLCSERRRRRAPWKGRLFPCQPLRLGLQILCWFWMADQSVGLLAPELASQIGSHCSSHPVFHLPIPVSYHAY